MAALLLGSSHLGKDCLSHSFVTGEQGILRAQNVVLDSHRWKKKKNNKIFDLGVAPSGLMKDKLGQLSSSVLEDLARAQ